MKFGYTCIWEPISGKKTNSTAVVLDCPKRKEPLGELAEVGGECFFSSVYYLMVGRKSGKRILKKIVKHKKNCEQKVCYI